MLETIGKWFVPIGVLFLLGQLLYGVGFKQGKTAGIHAAFSAIQEVLDKAEKESGYLNLMTFTACSPRAALVSAYAQNGGVKHEKTQANRSMV